MSVVVGISELSQEQQVQIHQATVFTSVVSYVAAQFGATPKKFYFRKTKDGKVYIPFMMGLSLIENYQFPEYMDRKPYKSAGPKLRPFQKEVLEEAKPILDMLGSVILNVPTGSGKGKMTIELLKPLKGKIVVLMTIVSLAHAWSENFKQHSTCESILILEKKKDLIKWIEAHDDFPDVLVVPIERTEWVPEVVRNEYANMVIDEAHLMCTKEYSQILLDWHPRNLIALTATTNRTDGMFKMMQAMAGQAVVRKSTRPFTVYKVENNLEPELEDGLSRNEIWHGISSWAASDDKWNRRIVDLVLRVNDLEMANPKAKASFEEFDEKGNFIPGKTLILCYRKAQVEKLSAIFTEKGVVHSTYYGSAKSYDDANVIIGTFKKMGTGFDEALACSTFNGRRFRKLVIAFTLKDLLLLEQSVGRVFRVDNPEVYVIVGKHGIFQNHWKIQEKYYKAAGAQIQDYDSGDESESEVLLSSESSLSDSEESEVVLTKKVVKKEAQKPTPESDSSESERKKRKVEKKVEGREARKVEKKVEGREARKPVRDSDSEESEVEIPKTEATKKGK